MAVYNIEAPEITEAERFGSRWQEAEENEDSEEIEED